MARSVLIVDDDELVVQFAHLVLAQAGFQVSSARSGEGALSALTFAQPSLVLLDIALARHDGFEGVGASPGRQTAEDADHDDDGAQ